MLKKLAAFLGVLCLVLLVMAFDEGEVSRGVDVVRSSLQPAMERLKARAAGLRTAPRPTSVAPGGHEIVGDFSPVGTDAPGGELAFDGAVLTFAEAPALRTRPHRIVLGREDAVRDMALAADHQVELRQIVPLDARTPVAASPLCAGQTPGWLAIARDGEDVRLQIWRAGPAPDAPGAVVCGRFAYEGDAR
jgi:hypothetical protein